MDPVKFQDRLDRALLKLLACDIERKELRAKLRFWRVVAIVAILTHVAITVIALAKHFAL